jgi:hypothetical protein
MKNKLILDTHIKVLVNKATRPPLRRLGAEIIKLCLQDGIGQQKDPAQARRGVHSARPLEISVETKDLCGTVLVNSNSSL